MLKIACGWMSPLFKQALRNILNLLSKAELEDRVRSGRVDDLLALAHQDSGTSHPQDAMSPPSQFIVAEQQQPEIISTAAEQQETTAEYYTPATFVSADDTAEFTTTTTATAVTSEIDVGSVDGLDDGTREYFQNLNNLHNPAMTTENIEVANY
jgi:hypothetical protein